MGKKILLIFKDDWADEMDVEGFDILSKEHWEYKKIEIKATEFPRDVAFGSNQHLEYDDAEEYLKCFQVHEISDEEEKIIRKYFGIYHFGMIPLIEGEASEDFYKEHGYCPD